MGSGVLCSADYVILKANKNIFKKKAEEKFYLGFFKLEVLLLLVCRHCVTIQHTLGNSGLYLLISYSSVGPKWGPLIALLSPLNLRKTVGCQLELHCCLWTLEGNPLPRSFKILAEFSPLKLQD